MGYSINDIKLKVTYYSRVSTDHLEQQNSLNNQTTYFENMIKNNKNWTYIPGYIEKGISGTTDYKREQFLNMINDAKNNKFDLIITKEISRFSRNTLDSIKYIRELLNNGVFVLFLNDNINTILPDSELRLTIMASMAQDEIRRLSERVKFGMNRSIESGNILGNNKLYGYKKYKNKLKIIKREAIIVKRLFNLYVIENLSLSKIAKLFNKENIKTNYGKKWTIQTLSRMIKNPKYKGYYCGKKTEVIDYINKKIKYLPKDKWLTYKDYIKIPTIVEEELWNKANKKLGNKKNKKNTYILSNKIYCQKDNHLYHRRKQKETTWLCSNYLNNGKSSCNTANLKEKELYSIIDDILLNINIDIKEPINILNKYYQQDVLITYLKEIFYKKIIDKILVSKTNDITLEIYLSLPKQIKYKNNYIFTRNKKEIIEYNVTCFSIYHKGNSV